MCFSDCGWSPHMYCSIVFLQIFRVLCVVLSSPCSWFPLFLYPCFQLWETTCLFLTFSFVTMVKNFLQVAIWSNFRSQLICFPSLRDHCPLLPTVQYLESCYLIFTTYLYSAFQAGESVCFLLLHADLRLS